MEFPLRDAIVSLSYFPTIDLGSPTDVLRPQRVAVRFIRVDPSVGFCLLWEPGLIWTYAISDIVTALAYFSIPATLLVVAPKTA